MDILVSDCGSVQNTTFYNLLQSEYQEMRYFLVELLKAELSNPKSELIPYLAQAMETIANSEIEEKVLNQNTYK